MTGWNSGNPSELYYGPSAALASSGASRTLGYSPAIVLQLGYVTTLSKCARHEGQTVALTSEGIFVFLFLK